MLIRIFYVCLMLKFFISVHASEEDIQYSDEEPDPEMEQYLREALENFREQMKEGIPAINMPVLDPLQLQNLDIKVDENLATMDMHIKEITIQDLSTFEFRSIHANLETFFLKLNTSLPILRANGTYNLDGRLMRIFPLNGNGRFEINITGVEIAGSGKLDFEDETLQMKNLNLHLKWEELAIFLENFLGGGRFSTVLQQILPKFGKSVFDVYKEIILVNMNKGLKDMINRELRKPEVKKIIDGIIPRY